jgi:hypothetical protein
MSTAKLRAAAIEVLRATDAYRDAVNGVGHKGEPHDRMLHFDPCTADPTVHLYDLSGDCANCGGAQYGTEDELHRAIGDLREAVGQDRYPWETP